MQIKEYLYKNKEDIFSKRLSGMQVKDLANLYNVKVQTMSGFLIENNIRWRRKITNEDIPDIIQKYNEGKTLKEIGIEYHCDPNKISRLLKKEGIHIKTSEEMNIKYTLDKYYFDVIDTQNKAYILGLLYADGNRTDGSNTISINLQEQDKDILDKINKEIGSNRPLYYIDYSQRTDANRVNQWKLSISNKHMAGSLLKYGLEPCKEFKTSFPQQIDEQLWRHFIRGYMDGDGCILKGECRWFLTGSKELLLFIKKYLESTLNIHVQEFYHKNGRTYNIRVSGRNQVNKLLDFLYKDATLFLERKYNIYSKLYKQS